MKLTIESPWMYFIILIVITGNIFECLQNYLSLILLIRLGVTFQVLYQLKILNILPTVST